MEINEEILCQKWLKKICTEDLSLNNYRSAVICLVFLVAHQLLMGYVIWLISKCLITFITMLHHIF